VNGLTMDEDGKVVFLDRPYPGSNLFHWLRAERYIYGSKGSIVDEQLNGGTLSGITDDDWNLIYPYLLQNEKHFGIKVEIFLPSTGYNTCRKESIGK